MNYRFSETLDSKRHRIGVGVWRSKYYKHLILSALLISAMILSFAGDIIAQGPPPGGPPGGQQSEKDIRVMERDKDGKAARISFFNVVNANIQDILKFMSDETNLTIIASEKIQGKITIVNLKGVTVDEALNALKTSLLSLGFTMVRVNKTIVIVPVGEAKTRPLRVQIGSDPNMMESTDEMITQIMPLNSADAAEMAVNLKNLIPKDADIFADTTTNSLIITDTSANIHRLALIIKQLDTQPSGVLKTQIFQLKFATATALTQTLNDLFRQGVDTARAFQKMSSRGPDEMMKMLGQARQEGKVAGRGIDVVRGQVIISGDDRTNKLIVTASETNMAIIEKMIEELDSSQVAQAEMRVFILESGIATDVAEELQTLLQGSGGQNLPPWERWRSRELQTTTKGIQGSINIVSDDRLNAVIVSSDPQNFVIIEEVIKILDQSVKPQEVIKIMPLKYADAATIVQTLEDLFQGGNDNNTPWWMGGGGGRGGRNNRGGGQQDQNQITGIRGDVNLVADTRLNAIVISTAATNLPIIEELIGKMDITIPGLETDTRIFPLMNSDAESVAEILSNVYSQGNQNRGGGGMNFFWMPRQSRNTSQSSGVITGSISIEAYTRTNSLLVTTSSARNFDIVQRLIDQLDQPTPSDYKYSTFIYPLEYSDAGEMESLLTNVFSEEGGGGSSRGRGGGGGQASFFRMMMTGRSPVPRDTTTLFGQVRINSDSMTNSLIVTTPERNQQSVIDVIKQLDVSRGQVWMEIKVLEVTLGEENNLGLDWNWKEGNHLGKNGLNAVFGTDFNIGDSSLGFTYKIFNKNLTATLNALMKENKVEVLSAPSVLTRDNQATTLSRGKDIPYLQSSRVDQFGQVIYSYDFLNDIGINISLTPHIAKYGTKSKVLKEGEKRTIGLEITRINVSSFLEYTDFNAPVTADSTITSYVDIEDGEQIAVGGMIKKESKNTIHKFPILGSIPFVGRIFNRTAGIVENTQLWVLITPHIIDINKPEDKETLKKLQEEQRNQVEMKMNEPEFNNNGASKNNKK
ncbi:MAG: secretin N-terminal domain-containing protein [Candidatus Poribacteria bacterium]